MLADLSAGRVLCGRIGGSAPVRVVPGWHAPAIQRVPRSTTGECVTVRKNTKLRTGARNPVRRGTFAGTGASGKERAMFKLIRNAMVVRCFGACSGAGLQTAASEQ